MKRLAEWTGALLAKHGTSFRKKALGVALPGLVIASIVYTSDAVMTERAIMKKEIYRRAEVIAHLASRIGEVPLLSENPELIRSAMASLRGVHGVTYVAFYTSDLRLLVSEGPLKVSAMERPPKDLSLHIIERNDHFDICAPVFTIRAKDDISMFSDDPFEGGIKENAGWVRVGFSKAEIIEDEQAIIARGLLFAVILTSAIGGLMFVMFTIATRPLSDISRALRGMQGGKYPELQVSSRDEVGMLAAEYNKMANAVRDREMRLKESENRIRTLFDRVEHAVFRIDREGTVVESNPKFIDLCGNASRFDSLFNTAPGDADRWRQGHVIRNVEKKISGADGEELTVILSLYPEYDGEGTIVSYDGYFVDITEKKKLEESLVQTQKIESIGLLAGGIAHDFNNILTGILGYASLLKIIVRPEDKDISQYAESIEKSAMRASGITRQLLGFARKGKYITRRMDINQVVKELVEFIRETFDRKISIIDERAAQGLLIEGDSNQLYQALMNLCINARDAMPEGGKLTILTERCMLSEEDAGRAIKIPKGDYAVIRVTDTGAGMAQEVMRKIFDPFFTTKDVGKGTGLGLSMVYGIVRNHGGYVDVGSEVGKGTTFEIYLPTTKGEEEEGKIPPAVTVSGSGSTVLIIDDEEEIRNVGRDILTASGYKVLLAKDGDEGISLFRRKGDEIDLVMLDMIMPGKDGRQVFEELKLAKPDIRVVLCSGYGQESLFKELFRQGAVCLLQKPFQVTELLRTIEASLGTRHTGQNLNKTGGEGGI